MAFSLLKNLFSSKPKGPEYDHQVWGSQEGKWKYLVGSLQSQAAGNRVLLLVWFPKTLQNLTYLLTEMGITYSSELSLLQQAPVVVALADDYLKNTKGLPANIAVWVVEHYPLHAPELAVFEKVKQEAPNAKPVILASLDERLFATFGGERIKGMLASMGGGPDEMIEHAMVKTSVVRAQQKVAEGVITEMKAQSDEEWFMRNYKKPL